jgi:S1-C subfamily serine protease
MKKIQIGLILLVMLAVTAACSFSFQPNTSAVSTSIPSLIVTPTAAALVQSNPLVTGDAANLQNSLVSVYDRVNPGIVAIQVLTDQGEALGSGFVFDTDGHIVTNYHVVEGASELEVDFPSGLKTIGKVIGTDLDSDLAIVKVDVDPSEYHPLTLGDSDLLKPGQFVIAIGNPFGLNGTMTVGVVSAVGRTLDSLRASPDGTPFTAGDIIQTDAAINPGNSGGPLLNLNGEVVGVNRAIRTDAQSSTGEPTNSGIGFAVSGNIIKRVVPALIQSGKYDYPYLGLSSLPDLSLIVSEALGLKQTTGAYVISVTSGGPADRAGIIAGTQSTSIRGLLGGGDLIIAVDGKPIQVFGDLLAYLMSHKSPGDTITLTIIRNNQQKEIPIVLEKRP